MSRTFDVKTVIEYEDVAMPSKDVGMVMLIDPIGYVYEQTSRGKLRVEGATVSLYALNEKTKEGVVWAGDAYRQTNPVITADTGEYSFLLPPGAYYLRIEASGYLAHESKPFRLSVGDVYSQNVELKRTFFGKFQFWR